MFKKLLSNLPFNPSLLGQVSFYAKRLHREEALRRTGILLLGLAFLVQLFAFLSPPQPTIANSNNDIINGGFATREQAILHCLNPEEDFYTILQHYGITCEDIANAGTVQLNSRDYNGQLFSMGRIPYGKEGETPVEINGTNFFLRYLWSWDSYGSSTYTALQGQTKYGLSFWILFNCGNLVFNGLATPLPPPPPPPPPTPTPPEKCELDSSIEATDPRCKPCKYNQKILEDDPNCKPCEASQTREDKTPCLVFSKTARNDTQKLNDANGTTAAPGDVITYTLNIKNTGKEKVEGFVIRENLSDVLDYAEITNLNGGKQLENNDVTWPKQDIKAGGTIAVSFTVRVKSPIPQTPTSSSDRGHFDLVMTNVYGNTVNIKVPGNPIKQIEVVTGTLPNTGPGETLAAAFVITSVAGFFFARTKLMAKEVDIARAEYITSGGQ